jgi:hypothetical protein
MSPFLEFQPLIYPIYHAHIGENEVLQQGGRVDHAVRCVVVDSNWKRVRVKTDLVAPWVDLGSLKGSEPSMMWMEASKERLDATFILEAGYCQGKEVSPQLFSHCLLAMPVPHFHFDLAASLKNGPPVPPRRPRSPPGGFLPSGSGMMQDSWGWQSGR